MQAGTSNARFRRSCSTRVEAAQRRNCALLVPAYKMRARREQTELFAVPRIKTDSGGGRTEGNEDLELGASFSSLPFVSGRWRL
jgi:hypothetical protein